ncbi:unnamed protein product [Adineta steineri]|uniref:EGF-like domain-containing protein n=1 Tax=Adineta steineri TaxID=433720 RepID=A0A815Q4Y5_9BILA|nr:unnamed protein product [Adineta steineri]
MKSIINFFIFTTIFYFPVQALNCNDNPCDLGGYFIQEKGYQCIQMNTDVLCTCPHGGYEMNQPCRVCNRVNPANNPCHISSAFIACLETNDYGKTFACLCSTPSGPVATTSNNCDSTVTTTTTSTSITPLTCSNGGYLVDGICHCPSGYGGISCEQKYDEKLCEKIICKNRGVCAIRNPNGPYESVCLCRYGISGDYCQLNGTLGFCMPNFCLNNSPCKENIIGVTRHAYCDCQPGYNGLKCQNRILE